MSTIEEKAKAYDEALERAKNFIENGDEGEKTVAESIFSGLIDGESEDERICKDIIQFFRDASNSKTRVINSNTFVEWAEYLEKQKHLYETTKDRFYSEGFEEGQLYEKQKEQKSINESNMHEPTLDEARKWNEAYEKGYSLGYKNGRNEQKPAQYDLDVLEKHITKDSISELAHTVMIRNGWDIVEQEQKPEEKPINWTELTWEDINELEDIINKVHYEFRNGIGEKSFGEEVLERFREERDEQEQPEVGKYDCPTIPIEEAVEVTSRMQHIDEEMKPIAKFIMDYASWNLHKDEWNQPVIEVPLFRVLDALVQKGKPYCCAG